MKVLEVTAIKHHDVRGKELLYIKIGDVVINVGEKTYKEVGKLTGDVEEEPAKLTIQEPVTKIQIAEPLVTNNLKKEVTK